MYITELSYKINMGVSNVQPQITETAEETIQCI